MSILVAVALLSGRKSVVEVAFDSTIDDLRQRAQPDLGTGVSKLISVAGEVLPLSLTVAQAGLQNGDTLGAIVRREELVPSRGAFALLRANGSVLTWGHPTYPSYGADSSVVQEQLRNVRKISASSCAFAAILDDGSVVTWGDLESGGDSSRVQSRL
ncbi:unnamed protein product, partial [Symbiodinium pilosum]